MSKKKVKEPKRRNLVAKNAITFNKYKVQSSKKDKQKHGKRKHRIESDGCRSERSFGGVGGNAV